MCDLQIFNGQRCIYLVIFRVPGCIHLVIWHFPARGAAKRCRRSQDRFGPAAKIATSHIPFTTSPRDEITR